MCAESTADLRRRLEDEMTALVAQQRLAQLQQGGWAGVVGRAKKAKGARALRLVLCFGMPCVIDASLPWL